MPPDIQELYDLALAAREHSYSPITNFKVGSAVRMSGGDTYAACNIESVTFNNSVHAEMNAIAAAVAHGSQHIDTIMVLIDSNGLHFPCALCRQMIIEFGSEAKVVAANLKGEFAIKSIAELYPEPFVHL